MAAAKKSGYNIFAKIILIPLSYQLLIFALAICVSFFNVRNIFNPKSGF